LAVVDFGEASTSMRNTPQGRARFGVFELDLKAGELHKDGQTVLLQEQPLQVLRMLVVRAGGLVTREEIQKKLWPNDTVVEFDHGINTAIQKLRQALGDSADKPTYIQTVARRGYRFVMPVERLDTSAPIARDIGIGPRSTDETGVQVRLEPVGLTGKTVSHYRVLGIVGGGGMGVVYKAEDLKLGRAVALKFLPEEVGDDPRALERFQREARTASSLNHPNICTIYEIEEHEGQPFIVMELLEGRTLRDQLAAATLAAEPLSIGQVLNFALQISEGLEAAHEKGIIHRDIKPANIFITTKGVAKILDFGLAKLVLRPSAVHAIPAELGGKESLTLSRAGVAIGTAAYMSPEQVRGQPLDARTDLFSFGLVLYEMATGQRAFTGEGATAVQDAILNHAPAPPAELNPELPSNLQDVIQKCLEKDRNPRYQNAAEVRAGLEKVKRRREHSLLSRWKLLATAAVVVIALLAGGLYWRSRKAIRLTEKDTIVLADFTNTTGDSVFDDTLKQGLAVQLEQSPFLAMASETKVNGTLHLMGRPAGDRLTSEVTREVCQRTGSKAMVIGSIAGLGSQYVIGLKAVNCDTGDVLAEAQESAAGKEAVLKALDAAAVTLRGNLGESLNSVQKYATPLEEATTPSLEALQAYSLGRKTSSAKGDTAALPFYKRAVELDPNFAMAYRDISAAYNNLNEAGRAAENAEKAYELREKVSERERFSIEAFYYMIATGELEKAAEVYELWQQTYPRDDTPYTNLGFIFSSLGNGERALEEAQEAMRLEPNDVTNYANLGAGYENLNRLDEAEAVVFKQPEERKLENEHLLANRYFLAFLKGNTAQMARSVSAAMGKPGTEDLLLAAEADTEAWHGKLKNARELTQRAADSAQRNDAKETAATYRASEALREVESGNWEQARADADAAVKLAPIRDVQAMTALALARAGDTAGADKLAAELDKHFPLDTLVQRYWLPTIGAAVALQRKNPNQAAELLRLATTIELGQPTQVNVILCPAYVRGEAYLVLHDGKEAAVEFQKFIDHYGLVDNFPLGALARLGLARAYALDADKAPPARDKARTAYQSFLTLWKDADPDIPIFKQAKAEYARLR
jgi:serine/threonine protein kinase/DNA-binding winged helix-turn-helix (wHTH) protein/tetratricopeptide (TPR) repeat protein